MNLYAIITARCSSERFPNKAVHLLGGKPMIEQVIIKTKKLKNIDGIVIATSILAVDNLIEKICKRNNVECYRGSNDELAERHRRTWDKYNITHAVRLSGDCPFFDLEIAQRIVGAVRDYPNYWSYETYSPIGTAISGHRSSATTRKYLEKQLQCYWQIPEPERMKLQECYVTAYQLPLDDPRMCLVDCSDIMPPQKTAIKIDIDYPLEMAIMNKVINHIGYFPDRYEDIERAYKEIKTI